MSYELRQAALSQAAHDLKGAHPACDVVARATQYLDFLEGKPGVSTGRRAGLDSNAFEPLTGEYANLGSIEAQRRGLRG